MADPEMLADALVDALNRPDTSDEHLAELLLNAATHEPEALKLASAKLEALWRLTALQGYAVEFARRELYRYWQGREHLSLGDVLKIADEETRTTVVAMLEAADLM